MTVKNNPCYYHRLSHVSRSNNVLSQSVIGCTNISSRGVEDLGIQLITSCVHLFLMILVYTKKTNTDYETVFFLDEYMFWPHTEA